MDKEWLQEFMEDHVKGLIVKFETDLDNAKKQKAKGTSKKQKEKVGVINYKLTQGKKLKEKLNDLTNSLEYLEGNHIKNLKILL